MSDNSEDITIGRCPVCQSDEPIVYESHKGGFYVQCECCDMRGPRKDDERAAILVWNNLAYGGTACSSVRKIKETDR